MTTVVELLRAAEDDGRPAYERFANVVAEAIGSGQLAPRAKLPTVRQLASELGVSATTVMSMYARLAEQGHTTGAPGRGTFVTGPAVAARTNASRREPSLRRNEPWRRRALAESEARLRRRFPDALDLMRGSPAAELLPVDLARSAWTDVARHYRAKDLEYPLSLAIAPELGDLMVERFARDGIATDREALVAMNSAQQCMAIVAQIIVRGAQARPVVAIEEPGYQTAMDTFERAGCELIGLATDDHGVTPDSLRDALASGARLVVFTPRALSPTGVTWTAARRGQLADVLAPERDVLILEDDYYAELASVRCGSLLGEPRLGERVIHIRSFSKSLGPDLRVAVASVGAVARASLLEERSYADGWTSMFTQRALAGILASDKLDDRLRAAAGQYTRNRLDAIRRLSSGLDAAELPQEGAEGLHIWIHMPSGVRSDTVVEAAAHLGVLAADGEPFFLDPGSRSYLRVNVGAAESAGIPAISDILLRAIDESVGRDEVLLSP